jgi:hypothetical protein
VEWFKKLSSIENAKKDRFITLFNLQIELVTPNHYSVNKLVLNTKNIHILTLIIEIKYLVLHSNYHLQLLTL